MLGLPPAEEVAAAPVLGLPSAEEVNSLPPALGGAALSCKFVSSIPSGDKVDTSTGTYWSTVKTLTVPSGSKSFGGSPGFHSNPKPFSMHNFPNDNTLHGLLSKMTTIELDAKGLPESDLFSQRGLPLAL